MAGESLHRMTAAQIRETVVGLVENRLFLASSLPENEALMTHFMPLIGGWPDGVDPKEVGNIVADMADAAEMGINGYPCFFKCRIIHRDDWATISDMATRAEQAIHSVVFEEG